MIHTMHGKAKIPFWQQVLRFTEIKWAIKTGVAGAIGLYVGTHLGFVLGEEGASTIISGLWCAISAVIIVSQAHLGSSFKAAWIRFLGTAIGAALGSAFTTFLGSDPFSLGIGLSLTIVICSVTNLRTGVPLTCATLAIVMILWELRPEQSPWLFALYRFLDAFLGIVIAVTVAYVLWPERASRKLHESMAQIVCLIHQLFLLSISEHSVKKRRADLEEEIEGALEQNFLYLKDARLETVVNKEKALSWNQLHRQFHHLFDHMSSLKEVEEVKPLPEAEELIDRMLLELFQSLETGQKPTPLIEWKGSGRLSVYGFVLQEIIHELEKIRHSCENL